MQDAPKERYTCSHCPKSFSVLEYLQLHEEYHTFGQLSKISCTQAGCRAEFFTAAKLNRHLYEAHYRDSSPPPADQRLTLSVCRCCQREFQSQLEMLVHRLQCELTAKRPTETFPCSRCRKVFTASRFLANHILTCEGSEYDSIAPVAKRVKSEAANSDADNVPVSRFSCDHAGCGKVFSKQVPLRNHLYTHSRYPFACSVPDCGAGFSQQENYLRHAREAHPNSPVQLVSCEKCSQKFGSPGQLETHVEEAHEEEEEDEDLLGDSFCDEQEHENYYPATTLEKTDFVCKMAQCSAPPFQRRADLRRHYIVEHNDTLVTCSKCNRKFGDREGLNEHLEEQHGGVGVEPVSCPFCGAEFLLKRLLKIHLVSQHPRPWSCPACARQIETVAAANMHRIMHLPKVTHI